MDSNLDIPGMSFPSTSENVAEEQAPPKSKQWFIGNELVGSREKASFINTLPMMEEIVVDKNVEVLIMRKGGMDINEQCVSDCMSLDNFGQTVGYKGHVWNECKRRLGEMKRDEIVLWKVDNGWPDVG